MRFVSLAEGFTDRTSPAGWTLVVDKFERGTFE